ncbi:MAG: AAA family ATPase [Planctomycetes bacterium]|nr:AAA family ATPase [Planctomycetota bacterium]
MTNPTEPKSVRLAQYLRELAWSRGTEERNYSQYEDVYWFHHVPMLDGCRSAAHRVEGEAEDDRDVSVWLEVADPEIPQPPEPPEALVPWMDPEEFRTPRREPPRLLARALLDDPSWIPTSDGKPDKVLVRLEDRPGIEPLHSEYCDRWYRWAEELEDLLRARELYEKLYGIHRKLTREGELLELRVGFGLLDWAQPGGVHPAVCRHVVTASADLTFDPRLGVIRIECPETGTRVTLEKGMINPDRLPDNVITDQAEQLIRGIEADDAVWDTRRMFEVIRMWGRSLDPRFQWNEGLVRQEGDPDVPTISWAPGLILRKRGLGSTIRIYDALLEQLRCASEHEAGEGPPGWRALFDNLGDSLSETERTCSGGEAWPDEGDDIYFPLPANAEQSDIAETIRTRRGVLVQGPPGTGKSHTIANLMCHLLASGQRVLVTAENPRALEVLRDKLPEDLKPLCISMLEAGGDAFNELRATVEGISSKRALWNERAGAERIQELKRELGEARAVHARIVEELRDLRASETAERHISEGYRGRAQQIAKKVHEGRQAHGWLSHDASDDADPPARNRELVRWLELTRTSDPEREGLAKAELIPVSELPTALDVRDLLVRIQDRERRCQPFAAEPYLHGFERLMGLPSTELATLGQEYDRLSREALRLPTKTWHREALEACRASDHVRWDALLDESRRFLDEVKACADELKGRTVFIKAKRATRAVLNDANALLDHFRQGGRWKNLLGLGTPKAVKGREYIAEDTNVDGRRTENVEDLEAVVFEAKRRQTLIQLIQRWQELEPVSPQEKPDVKWRLAQEWVSGLGRVLEHGAEEQRFRRRLEDVLAAHLTDDWFPGGQVTTRHFEAAIAQKELRETTEELSALEGRLTRFLGLGSVHEVVHAVHQSVLDRDSTAYKMHREGLEAWWKVRLLAEERTSLDGRISEAVPELRQAILDDQANPDWARRLSGFEEAWAWRHADLWLQRFSDPQRNMVLEGDRRRAEKTIRSRVSQLAAEMAWQKFFQRLSPVEDEALKSWLNTVKQMGKGKGRSAKLERLRRQARAHIDRCRDAIPIWVMPRYLVADMIQVSPNRFDTVIVDEASQMGVDGLFVFYVGKRAVIVGDDQQISPSDVGLSDDAVEMLQRRYLFDFEHANALGRGGNVYDNAQIRFGRPVTLREHFRCMPEIIQFSNDLCYAPKGTPLDPMRSFQEDRLPPLRAVRVEGRREGASGAAVNRIEAEAIVEQIQRCIEDSAYDGKTIGVISLTGGRQAREIESKLLARLDPETIEERRIICGDAYAFQGDERHVIFLSMVAAAGDVRLTSLTGDRYRQRFNVAASRAQDQLWLFHSLDLADLKPECLRHRLLQYVRNPSRTQADISAQTFDSPFEEEVYREIVARGYRAVTQHQVGNHSYRIDIVVQGLAGNLAVECDGDRWHGPEHHDRDMARQRDLERVGWAFVRIRGSAFYRDRETALKPLWSALEERGIRPAGQEEGQEEEPRSSDGHIREMVDGGEAGAVEIVQQTPQEEDWQIDVDAARSHDSNSRGDDPRCEPRIASLPTGTGSTRRTGTDESHNTHHRAFELDGLPDPRDADLSEIRAALVDVIGVHGPLPMEHAFKRYIRAAGIGRLGQVLRENLKKAARSALRADLLEEENEWGKRGSDRIIRVAGSPPIRPRELGDREFDEIPPREWAYRMLQCAEDPTNLEEEDFEVLYRKVLAEAGWKGLTEKRRPVLDRAFDIARDPAFMVLTREIRKS